AHDLRKRGQHRVSGEPAGGAGQPAHRRAQRPTRPDPAQAGPATRCADSPGHRGPSAPAPEPRRAVNRDQRTFVVARRHHPRRRSLGAARRGLPLRPSTEDLLDPLGRPATLTDSIVSSSAGLDRVTTVLVPKQAELTRRISVLTTVAGSLDEVVDHAGELTPLAGDANRGIAHVVDVSRPLPALITRIAGHANDA